MDAGCHTIRTLSSKGDDRHSAADTSRGGECVNPRSLGRKSPRSAQDPASQSLSAYGSDIGQSGSSLVRRKRPVMSTRSIVVIRMTTNLLGLTVCSGVPVAARYAWCGLPRFSIRRSPLCPTDVADDHRCRDGRPEWSEVARERAGPVSDDPGARCCPVAGGFVPTATDSGCTCLARVGIRQTVICDRRRHREPAKQ
jgi:hypothetical protein